MSGRFPWQIEHDTFDIFEKDEKCGSLFGNFDIDIYDEDIEALKAGKQLYFIDEYGFRVHYKEGPKPEKKPEPISLKDPRDYISEEFMAIKKEVDGGYSYKWEDWPE